MCRVALYNELTRKKGKQRKTVSHIDPKDEWKFRSYVELHLWTKISCSKQKQVAN